MLKLGLICGLVQILAIIIMQPIITNARMKKNFLAVQAGKQI